MSDTKTITGVCTEIAQKPGSEWTEFHIDGGGQYPVRLSTKLQPLIELGKAVGSNLATWTYEESQGNPNPNRPGTFYMNRYLSKVEVGGADPGPENASAPPSSAPHHSPLIAGDKDRAITRMACLKATAELYHGALGSNDVDNDVIVFKIMETTGRFEQWIYRDIDEVPF